LGQKIRTMILMEGISTQSSKDHSPVSKDDISKDGFDERVKELSDAPPKGAVDFIKNSIPTWSEVSTEEFTFKRASGLTNKTYKVDIPEIRECSELKPKSAFLRVFDKDGLFFDRKRETRLMQHISDCGLGPKPYGFSNNFRLEEYFENSRTLKTEEMKLPEIGRKVAANLAKFHAMRPVDMDQTPLIDTLYLKGDIRQAFFERVKWEKSAGHFSDKELKEIEEIQVLLSKSEESFLSTIAPSKHSTLVFSHNDLLPGNILLIGESEKIKFIDYEYSSYNYRGFDIANYLNESILDYDAPEEPGFKVREDWSFSSEEIDNMIFYYVLFSKGKELGVSETELDKICEIGIDGIRKSELMNKDLMISESKALKEELKACTLMSHAYWIVWAIIMCKNPEIDFDYINFAYQRFILYQKLKKQWFGCSNGNVKPMESGKTEEK